MPFMRQNSSSDDLPRLVSYPLHYKYHPASYSHIFFIIGSHSVAVSGSSGFGMGMLPRAVPAS